MRRLIAVAGFIKKYSGILYPLAKAAKKDFISRLVISLIL